jgi:hypothetical protein
MGMDFWKRVAPDQLIDSQSEIKQGTNHLVNFLANGNDFHQVLFVEGERTSFEDLEKAYSYHMKFHHKIDKAKIGGDNHPIRSAGYVIKMVNLCKTCRQSCTKANCGDHYDSKNRYQKKYCENMVLKVIRDSYTKY